MQAKRLCEQPQVALQCIPMQCNVGLGRVKEEIVLELTLEISLKAHLAKIQATGK